MVGVVKSINVDRGFGFISSGGRDYFFHVNELGDRIDFNDLLMHQDVEFDPEDSPKGVRAVNVRTMR